MPTAPNGAEVFIGSGKVYFDRFDTNGNSTGFRFLGNATKFENNPQVDTTDVWNMTRKSRTKLAKITKTQTHSLAIDLDEVNPKNLAICLLASVSVLTQTGGSITSELIASSASTALLPAPAAGIILKVANRNISAVVLKTSSTVGGSGTAMATTDYEIEDAGLGLIRILPTASIPNGTATITADYTAAAITATANKAQLSAGATPQIIGAFKLVGDPVSGRAQDVEIWRAQVVPSGAFGFISEDKTMISISAEILSDEANHPANPYYQITER